MPQPPPLCLADCGGVVLRCPKPLVQARGVFAMMWGLLRQVAPHLPADAATLADLQQRLAGQPSDDAMLQEELRGVVPIVLTATGLARMSDAPATVGSASASSSAGDASSSSSSQRRQVSTPEEQHLAVRRAQALGLLKCANPQCASLAGTREAAAKGRKCGGCRVVRYCCEACSKADWKQHRVACRLLQQQASGA